MAAERVLYWGSGSPPCWRVMAVLAEKNLQYTSKQVTFSNKEHKSETVLALNPRGQVPTFKDGPVVVNESVAALLYLEQKYPEPCLMPPELGPQVLQRLCEVNNVQEAARAVIRGDPAAFDSNIEALKKELTYWESYLSASKYVAGDQFTLADFAFATFGCFFLRQGGAFDEFPKLKAYLEQAKTRPSIQETWPPHWKEDPPSDMMKLKGRV